MSAPSKVVALLRRELGEWMVLFELTSEEEKERLRSQQYVPLIRPAEEWQRLKRLCTPAEWTALLNGGETPKELQAVPLFLTSLITGWTWLHGSSRTHRRGIVAEYGHAIPNRLLPLFESVPVKRTKYAGPVFLITAKKPRGRRKSTGRVKR